VADITDAQIVAWSNTRSRVLANKMADLYAVAVAYQNDWAAQGLAARITAAGAANNIGDNYQLDGKPIITGTALVNFKAAIDQVKANFDTLVSGVGSPVTTIVNGIQTDGSPR
jgi:hypothetical protein